MPESLPSEPQPISLADAKNTLQSAADIQHGIQIPRENYPALEVFLRESSVEDIFSFINRLSLSPVYVVLREMEPRPDSTKIAKLTTLVLQKHGNIRAAGIASCGLAGNNSQARSAIENIIDKLEIDRNASVDDIHRKVCTALAEYLPKELESVQAATTDVVDPQAIQKAVEAVKDVGQHPHTYFQAVAEAKNMNGREWSAFLVELRRQKFGALADMLGEEFEKNGNQTVYTTRIAVQGIMSRGDLRLAMGTARTMTEKMSPAQRARVAAGLRKHEWNVAANTLTAEWNGDKA